MRTLVASTYAEVLLLLSIQICVTMPDVCVPIIHLFKLLEKN